MYFTEYQGYYIYLSILFQDNMAKILLEVNGPFSCSKRTKHISAIYFFIKEKIEDRELKVQYLPTENMQTGILNHPDQGMKFCKDKAALINVPVDYDDEFERKKTHPLLLPREK